MKITLTKNFKMVADGSQDVRNYEAGKCYESGHAQEAKMFDWLTRNGFAIIGGVLVDEKTTGSKIAEKHKIK